MNLLTVGCLLPLLLTPELYAQSGPSLEEAQRRADAILKSAEKQTNLLTPPGPDRPQVAPTKPPDDSDALTKAKYNEALREYYSYYVSGIQHRRAVFSWQFSSSRVIFVVVLLLVAAGMYFAAVQFHAGMRHRKRGKDAPELTEIEASVTGVKVSSPVLGVIILMISLGFFYLYLDFVYPITNTF